MGAELRHHRPPGSLRSTKYNEQGCWRNTSYRSPLRRRDLVGWTRQRRCEYRQPLSRTLGRYRRTRREVLRQSRVGRSAEAASAKPGGGAPQANPLAPADLHAQLTELAALIRERPDRTLAELREAAHAGESSPRCPPIKRHGFRFKKNGYTRRNTIALTPPRRARSGAPRRRRSIPRASCFR